MPVYDDWEIDGITDVIMYGKNDEGYQPLMTLDNLENVSITKESEKIQVKDINGYKVCSFSPKDTLTIDFECPLDENVKKILFGQLKDSEMPKAYDITYVKPVQKRKHKKKRINKKWKKKYGYEFKEYTTKGWKIQRLADGTIEFER